jgi:hypothetical protein
MLCPSLHSEPWVETWQVNSGVIARCRTSGTRRDSMGKKFGSGAMPKFEPHRSKEATQQSPGAGDTSKGALTLYRPQGSSEQGHLQGSTQVRAHSETV